MKRIIIFVLKNLQFMIDGLLYKWINCDKDERKIMSTYLDLGPPYDAIAVANTILQKAQDENISVDPMKLQKLIYFAHGWHLAIYDKPLINEPIQAWEYGPVISSIYHMFKKYGAQPITDSIRDVKDNTISHIENEEVLRFLDNFLKIYGGLSAIELSNMSHLADSPWNRTRKEFPNAYYIGIPPDYIKEYFQKIAQQKISSANDR